MQVGSDEWKALLIRAALQMGVALDAQQAGRMAVHASALVQWNRRINLTAITDPVHIAIKHFLDAVLPISQIPAQGRLLDMGTGGGFPGIPLKVMRPDQSMTLIDAARKKINFVKYVLRALNATDISAVQARAETMGNDPAYRGRFQAVVCRAFSDLATIARLAAPLLVSDGRICVYQGPGGSPECTRDAEGDPCSYRILATYRYILPILGDRRILRIMQPTNLQPSNSR